MILAIFSLDGHTPIDIDISNILDNTSLMIL